MGLLEILECRYCISGWRRNNYSVNVFMIRFTHIQLKVTFFMYRRKRNVGPPSVVDRHPDIIEIVNDFFIQLSSSAHDQRKDDAQYSYGVTLSAIRSHVLREIPSLKEISVHTIQCLLLPPNKNRKQLRITKA